MSELSWGVFDLLYAGQLGEIRRFELVIMSEPSAGGSFLCGIVIIGM